MINNDLSTSQSTSTTSTAKVYLGAYALRGRPPLDDGFIQAIQDLAASDNVYQNTDGLTGLVDQFGTHYVNRVYYGGLAAMTFTMSTIAKAKLDSLSVNGSLAGSVEGPGGMASLSIKGSGGYGERFCVLRCVCGRVGGAAVLERCVPHSRCVLQLSTRCR